MHKKTSSLKLGLGLDQVRSKKPSLGDLEAKSRLVLRGAQPGTGYSETQKKPGTGVFRDPVLYRPGSVPIDPGIVIGSFILDKPGIFRV